MNAFKIPTLIFFPDVIVIIIITILQEYHPMRRSRCFTVPPLSQEILAKTHINGERKTIYSVNGDSYTGEWKDNKKHGRIEYFLYF